MYSAYQILWAHRYHSFYKRVFEKLMMPLYKLFFLKECHCLSEEELEVVVEYGEFLVSKEGLYLIMYGGSKAPSLLPKYATDYVVHK